MNIKWPETNQDNTGSYVWKDITRHTTAWREYEEPGDLMTTSHETTHRVNADIRNSKGGKVNAFYTLNSTAIISLEPNMSKSVVAAFVPENLRESRFSTYVTGMNEWNDRPLYLWDEWSAYINGAFCAAELKRDNEYNKEWSDWAMGPLEFNLYGLAVMAAIHKNDPAGYKNLIGDFYTLWNRGWRAYYEAAVFFPWDRQTTFYNTFLSLSSGPLIDTLKNLNLSIPILRK